MKIILITIHNALDVLVGFICRIATGIVFVSVATMVCLLGFGVFSRYGFGYTPVFYEELAKFCLIWMTFAGGIVSMERGDHVAMEMLVDKCKGRASIFLRIVIQILIVVTAFLIFKYGLKFARNGLRGVFTSMDWLPLISAYVAVSCSYLSIGIIAMRNTFKLASDILTSS